MLYKLVGLTFSALLGSPSTSYYVITVVYKSTQETLIQPTFLWPVLNAMSINRMDINYVLNSAETDTNSIDEEQAPFESSTNKSYQADDVTQPAIPHYPLSE